MTKQTVTWHNLATKKVLKKLNVHKIIIDLKGPENRDEILTFGNSIIRKVFCTFAHVTMCTLVSGLPNDNLY